RESNHGPVALSPACIFNATESKADDVSSPHLRFRSSRFLHQLRDGETVLASSFILYTIEKLDDTSFSRFCFCSGHVRSIQRQRPFELQLFILPWLQPGDQVS